MYEIRYKYKYILRLQREREIKDGNMCPFAIIEYRGKERA
jgi:hypothetical protein